MPSDRLLIETDKAALRRQYSTPPVLTNGGALVVGKYYQILAWGSNDNFQNVGAPRLGSGDLPGKVFIAAGTTPAVWANGTRVLLIDVPALKTYATTLYDGTPSDVELTSATREGVAGSGQISNNLRIRRIAVEELIAELDPEFIAPAPLPRRPIGVTVRLGT